MCLATCQPLHYLSDASFRVMDAVHRLNRELEARAGARAGQLHAAYTFDAGPNAVLFTLAEHQPLALAMLAHLCESRMQPEGLDEEDEAARVQLDGTRLLAYLEREPPLPRDSVRRIICTRLGDGPRLRPI